MSGEEIFYRVVKETSSLQGKEMTSSKNGKTSNEMNGMTPWE